MKKLFVALLGCMVAPVGSNAWEYSDIVAGHPELECSISQIGKKSVVQCKEGWEFLGRGVTGEDFFVQAQPETTPYAKVKVLRVPTKESVAGEEPSYVSSISEEWKIDCFREAFAWNNIQRFSSRDGSGHVRDWYTNNSPAEARWISIEPNTMAAAAGNWVCHRRMAEAEVERKSRGVRTETATSITAKYPSLACKDTMSVPACNGKWLFAASGKTEAFLVWPIRVVGYDTIELWHMATCESGEVINKSRKFFDPRYHSYIAKSKLNCSTREWEIEEINYYDGYAGTGDLASSNRARARLSSPPNTTNALMSNVACFYFHTELEKNAERAQEAHRPKEYQSIEEYFNDPRNAPGNMRGYDDYALPLPERNYRIP